MDDEALDFSALGQAIVRRREALGWSTHRLAQRAQVGDPYVRRLEAGNTKRVGIEILARLAQALRTNVDDLLRDAGLSISDTVGPEISTMYAGLDEPSRRAWLRMGAILQQMQSEYARRQARYGEADEPQAAYDRPDLAEAARRDVEEWTQPFLDDEDA